MSLILRWLMRTVVWLVWLGSGAKAHIKTKTELAKDLQFKGFDYKGKSPNAYERYKGPDGKTVMVKSDGEVINTHKVWNPDGSGKYSQRHYYQGNPIPDQLRSMCHYVE
jgi:hypothetical protein